MFYFKVNIKSLPVKQSMVERHVLPESGISIKLKLFDQRASFDDFGIVILNERWFTEVVSVIISGSKYTANC